MYSSFVFVTKPSEERLIRSNKTPNQWNEEEGEEEEEEEEIEGEEEEEECELKSACMNNSNPSTIKSTMAMSLVECFFPCNMEPKNIVNMTRDDFNIVLTG